MIYLDGEKYIGEYKDGQRNGNGICTWPDGHKYEGQYKDNEFHGKGVYTWADGK